MAGCGEARQATVAAAGPDASLARLRAGIDRIDGEIHRLLMERAEAVDALVAAKGGAGSGVVIRPEREAAILERLAANHGGVLPFPVLAHLWRTLIAAFCRLQRPYGIVVAGADPLARDLARFHAGFEAPVETAEDGAAALSALEAGPGNLAFVPLGEAASPWWERLGEAGIHPVARLSGAVLGRPEVSVLVVGGRLVGPAGEGRTLFDARAAIRRAPLPGSLVTAAAGERILLEAPSDLSAERLAEALGAAVRPLGGFAPLPGVLADPPGALPPP